MIPSNRALALLATGLPVGGFIALVAGPAPALALLLCYDLAVAIAIVTDGLRNRGRRVTIERQVAGKLSIARDNPVKLVARARVRSRVRLRDDHPSEREAEAPIELALSPQSENEFTYTVRPTARGKYTWGDLWVRQLGPWGLAWDSWRLKQPQSVAVYPDLVGLRALTIRLAQQLSGGLRQPRRFTMGTEFREMREYAVGDDPRLIDWKATARASRPLVRVLEPEQEQTLIVLLDRGRLMGARLGELRRFDWGLNSALALAVAGLNRGDRVGIAVFDRTIHTWIPPERGNAHLGRLIGGLTGVQPELVEPDYLGAVTFLVRQQARRALVVMLTDLIDLTASAELLAALTRLVPRYLPFCVALRDPLLDRQAADTTPTAQAGFARAVAIDLIAQRSTALARLKQSGVLVLDAPVDQIGDDLVNQYLRLKARNRL